jgi:hypothetical protein
MGVEEVFQSPKLPRHATDRSAFKNMVFGHGSAYVYLAKPPKMDAFFSRLNILL